MRIAYMLPYNLYDSFCHNFGGSHIAEYFCSGMLLRLEFECFLSDSKKIKDSELPKSVAGNY